MLANLKPNEMLIAAGAAWILVVVYVLGDRLTEDYGAGVLLIVAPMAAALLFAVGAKHGGRESAWNSLYPASINALGSLIVLFLALDILNGLSDDFSSSGEFYEITMYVAGAAILGGVVFRDQLNKQE